MTTRNVTVDPHVQRVIVDTNGLMYQPLKDRLVEYPIPALRLRPTYPGQTFLDIGCNWGRWSVAAFHAGYRPVGLDSSLTAILAARRIASQLEVKALFVVADARHLPFRRESIDVAFSYSVWQHFSEEDVVRLITEVSLVLGRQGRAHIQMANAYGVRSLYHQTRRRFRPAQAFEVRYWRPGKLREMFERLIGPTELQADSFFSLNAQAADASLLPLRFRWVVRASDALRGLSRRFRWLTTVADSIFVTARHG